MIEMVVFTSVDVQNPYPRRRLRIEIDLAHVTRNARYISGRNSQMKSGKQLNGKDTQLQLGTFILLVLRRLFGSHLLIGIEKGYLSLIVRFCHVRFVDVDKFVIELFIKMENENPEVAACL
ncbi:hypothetical protein P5V15_011201 [Pogonomyrmex californicus]